MYFDVSGSDKQRLEWQTTTLLATLDGVVKAWTCAKQGMLVLFVFVDLTTPCCFCVVDDRSYCRKILGEWLCCLEGVLVKWLHENSNRFGYGVGLFLWICQR